MKINEVEARTGITKKNIRFYEEQKLLSPYRNAENGYRVYSEKEVDILLRIKMLRKLGVSIEDIRQMLTGTQTVGDGMRRHMIVLEREKKNVEHCIAICKELKDEESHILNLDVDAVMKHMEEMESSGATFQNKQWGDERVQYIAPVFVAILFLFTIIGTLATLFWACTISPEEAPPLGILVLIVSALVAVGIGVIVALYQRIREIGKGEIDDARKY